MGWLLPLLVLVGAAALVAYSIARTRGGQPIQFKLVGFVAAYAHAAMLVGIIVAAVGLAHLVNAGLSAAVRPEFSYGRQAVFADVGEGPLRAPVDPAVAAARESERRVGAFRAGLSLGLALLVTGALVYGLHGLAQRVLGPPGRPSAVRTVYLASLLVVFGAIALTAIPQALTESFDYAFGVTRDYFQGPGASVALAVISVPVWLALVVIALRRTRSRGDASPS